MNRLEAENITDFFWNKHRSLENNSHSIIVLEHPSDFSEEMKEKNIKGIHRPKSNQSYIFSSEHENKEELLQTLKHEIYGHYGLNTLSQENKINILLSVVHLQEFILKDDWEEVRHLYPKMPEFRQAEEVFSRIASEISMNPVLSYDAVSDPETRSDIHNIAKYIKMTLQTGDAKQIIVPKNDILQFDKEKELEKIYTVRSAKIIEINKEQLKSNETLFLSHKEAIIYQVATKNIHNFSATDKQVLSENFEEITSQAYKNFSSEIVESKKNELLDVISGKDINENLSQMLEEIGSIDDGDLRWAKIIEFQSKVEYCTTLDPENNPIVGQSFVLSKEARVAYAMFEKEFEKYATQGREPRDEESESLERHEEYIKDIHRQYPLQESSIEYKLSIELKNASTLSSNTKERILAYGSLMEDEALIDAVGSTDKEVLVSLGEYFQELSQSDYIDYETFDNSQTQEMRR